MRDKALLFAILAVCVGDPKETYYRVRSMSRSLPIKESITLTACTEAIFLYTKSGNSTNHVTSRGRRDFLYDIASIGPPVQVFISKWGRPINSYLKTYRRYKFGVQIFGNVTTRKERII